MCVSCFETFGIHSCPLLRRRSFPPDTPSWQADTVRKTRGFNVESSLVYRAFTHSLSENQAQFAEAPYCRLASLITPVMTTLLSPDALPPAAQAPASRSSSGRSLHRQSKELISLGAYERQTRSKK